MEGLFLNALRGMFALARVKINRRKKKVHLVKINAPDTETLLADFLSEALLNAVINKEAYYDVEFEKLSARTLEATLIGSPLLRQERDIKAVTYHNLKIIKKGGYYRVDITFDA